MRIKNLIELMTPSHRAILLVALAALLTACAGSPPTLVGSKADAQAGYIIGPGDVLSVFVYKAPELSADVPVRPDGRISTPLVADVVAAGKTPTQLANELEGDLRTYVKEPVVTVMVTSFVGNPDSQIRVIGEVAEPLAMPYRANLSLLDVVIASKGLTKFANGNHAIIVRQQPGGPKKFSDTLFVPQAWF
jgi:polysaccharide export outer membrane protein